MAEERATNPGAERQPLQRVLVVDDNHDAAESLALLLRLSGHDVCTTHAGQEALSRAETYRPDVVLLDIGLPDIDGLEVCRRLRDVPELAGMRIVAVTGYDGEHDRRQTREAGFDGHLVKPFTIDSLTAMLERERSG
jgi:CheY-like chemotaxis protein